MNRPWLLFVAFLFLASLIWGGWASTAGPAYPSSPAATAKRSSSIALTADGATLLVVNPDANSLSLVDTVGQYLIAELAVGIDPRTVAVDDAGQRAYVANRGSDTLSIVDLAARAVITDLVV